MPLSSAIETIISEQREDLHRQGERAGALARDVADGMQKLGSAANSGTDFAPGMLTMTELAEMYASGELSDEIIQEEADQLNICLS